MKILPMIAAIGLVLPVPAAARLEETPARFLAGRVAGPARDCLPVYQRDRESRTFASGDIAYRGRGDTWFLSHLSGCPRLRSQMAFVTREATGQLCRGDIVEVHDNLSGTFLGSCVLGAFVPYDRRGG